MKGPRVDMRKKRESDESELWEELTGRKQPRSSVTNSLQVKVQVRPFDGDPKNSPLFIATFKAVVNDVFKDNARRIAYLREFLEPHVANRIADLYCMMQIITLWRYAH